MNENVLKELISASGVSGYESEIAGIMKKHFIRICPEVKKDTFGNIIARKGEGKKKIMIAAHMDEIGLVIKHISKEGFLSFVKIGGIDDRVLVGQRVIVKSAYGDVVGIIGVKPPHLQKSEERKNVIKWEDMFIDIGCQDRKSAQEKVSVGDSAIFEPSFGSLSESLYFGKAIDDRVGCYALLRIMEQVNVNAQVFAVATVQEEVGLKGARTSSFKLNPDFALVIDTTIAGDTPQIKETESNLHLGKGVAITMVEAGGRGMIVNEQVKKTIIDVAGANAIPYQIEILDGGMTDGAMIYMNREGILTGVLSVPTRYIHSAVGVFHKDDLENTISLAVKLIETISPPLSRG